MKKFIIAVAVVLFIQGCATPYQPSGWFNGGYTEVQLDENVFKVSFRGNEFTNRARATNFTLLRSAELTLENGFKYFVIINESYGFGNSTTTTTGGYTYITSAPSVANTIILYKEKPDSVFSYNAELLHKSMKAEYDID